MQKKQEINAKDRKNSETVNGTIYVSLTKNNTMLTLADKKGDVVTWTSCQNCGFYGSQKTTPMATIITAEEMGLRAIDYEMDKVNVVFRGKPRLRNAVLRGLARSKVLVQKFIIAPTVPYNGCRLEKKSRK